MEKLSVFKIGGKVIDDGNGLNQFLSAFSEFRGKKILVHGGGKQIDGLSHRLGIKVTMVEGRRITDSGSLEVAEMVLGGLLNKNIVALLQSFQCNAIGMTGADGNLIRAVKRPLRQGIDYGWVGDVREVNSRLLANLLEMDMVPVIASLTHDKKGNMLNTNADTVAAEIAISVAALFETDLVYCFDLPGVLGDIDDLNSVIHELHIRDFPALKEKGLISKGMIPKIDNAFDALNRNVSRVILIGATNIEDYISGNGNSGTIISL